MRGVIVSVDLETTGLDPRSDEIIEIGAVKFEGDRVIDEFQSFVYPGCSIPPYITRLTGIRDSDVERAPRRADILPKLRRFIGYAPVLGHNVRFDLGMLEQGGLRLPNPLIDTYTLASVLIPNTPRYSLSSLATLFGVDAGESHRALDDAHRTRAIYLELYRRAQGLPLDTLAEIVRAGKLMPWDGAFFFEEVLKERSREVFVANQPAAPEDDLEGLDELFGRDESEEGRLRRGQQVRPVDPDEVAAVVEPGGQLARRLEGYEHRPQQATMMREVAKALNGGRHVLIEAPTGVGKSLAYLIPAAYFAVRNDDRVVISTNTINLQEQLIGKDIPLLHEALGLPFRAAVLKGRSNYLCPRRLAALRRRGPTSPEEMHILAKLLVWLKIGPGGDRSSLTLRGPDETSVWHRLSAEDEGCTTSRCIDQMGGTCPYYQARRRAEAAHLLIVNHSLLLSDVVAEGRVLPEYRHLIVDEAHHLEDAITHSLSFRTDTETIMRQLAEIGTAQSGMMGELLKQARGAIPDGYYETLRDYVDMIVQAGAYMREHVRALFETMQAFLEAYSRAPVNEYTRQVRIVNATRREPGWGEIELLWDNLSKFTSIIAEALSKLAAGLVDLEEYDIEDFPDLLTGIGAAARHITTLHARLNEIVAEPDVGTVYWAEFQPGSQRFSLHAAPLEVASLMQRHIWLEKESVILTSATLRTDGTFGYIRDRLGAQDVEEVVIDTPFDYEASTLLYIVSDIPEPNQQPAYQQAVEKGLLDLCVATGGRAMVLFTSYAQLRQTTNNIGDQLARAGIDVFDQTEGISRMQMLEGFIESERSVLMGTRSFWEGVDVPGSDLSVLVLVRLPFAVPTDPVFAARSETFDDAFNDYSVPDAILRFRQGFGRLIRRQGDRGVVAIFDRRVISKRYGSLFLSSLPRCTTRKGPMKDLPGHAVRWLEFA
ncbi:MAG: helicase C-terminal domain-containing protein [Anaerolineae bacterium]